MSTKTIKIPEVVHTELKVYTAKNKDKIEDIAGYAIMEYLHCVGHKFVVKPKKKQSIYYNNKK